jgi:hypothetical protein
LTVPAVTFVPPTSTPTTKLSSPDVPSIPFLSR